MSATVNDEAVDAVSNQPGEFGSHIPPTAPIETSGHQPGKKVGNDAIPESEIKTFPPGTAPAANTFQPNPINGTPGQASSDNYAARQDEEEEGARTRASDTLGGATSADVDRGYGKPVQGMSSQERHHDGQEGRKRDRAGLQGTGAEGALDGEANREYLDDKKGMPGADE